MTWLLLLTVPVALLGSAFLLFVTTLPWCGVSGCSGGGFGRVSEPDAVLAVASGVAAALLWFCAIGLVPWLAPQRMRLVLAAVLGSAAGLLVLFVGTAGFIRD
jgi:hypothetical protein